MESHGQRDYNGTKKLEFFRMNKLHAIITFLKKRHRNLEMKSIKLEQITKIKVDIILLNKRSIDGDQRMIRSKVVLNVKKLTTIFEGIF